MAIERLDRIHKIAEVEKNPEITIHDWDHEGSELLRKTKFKILDTTLRDGIQMPEFKYPPIEVRKRIIDLDARMGIEAVDLCMPATGQGTPLFKGNVETARYAAENYPQIERYVLTRAKPEDVEATLKFVDQANSKVSVILFRGSSDLRLFAEGWDEEEVIESMSKCTRELKRNGLKVIAATEDTTRTRPDFLKNIVLATKSEGADGFCVSDTVGYADPIGVEKQIKWLKSIIEDDSNYEIHFHGHDDTRNAVANTISALKAGASVGQVTWGAMGERAGNASLEGVMSDLDRRDINKYDLTPLPEGARMIEEKCNYPIPRNYPLVGANAFKHESGIHAAGVYKAKMSGNEKVAGKVYSAVDPKRVNRVHETTIGPLSGEHNVIWTLEDRGIEPTRDLIQGLLKAAKFKGVALNSEETDNVIREIRETNGYNGH